MVRASLRREALLKIVRASLRRKALRGSETLT